MIQQQKLLSESNSSFLSKIKDYVLGISVVVDFGIPKQAQAYFEDQNDILEKTKEKRKNVLGIFSTVIQLSSVMFEVGVFIFAGYLAIKGEISVGTILLFIQLMNFTMYPITKIPSILASRKATQTLMKPIDEKYQPIDEEKRNLGKSLKSIDKNITLTNVSVKYSDENTALDNVSYVFDRNKNYTIVGASGSGKSTLIKAIHGQLSNVEGEITYDTILANQISTNSFTEIFSYIDQNIFIFDDSLLFNITLGVKFSKSDLMSVINKAGLKSMVDSKGLDFVCGENGKFLSGGEKQRVSIARALLKNSSILLLDEINSSLDSITSSEIMNDIYQLDDTMVLNITHRLVENNLRKSDEIIVMKKGSIIESGSFDELISQKGLFYSLYRIELDA